MLDKDINSEFGFVPSAVPLLMVRLSTLNNVSPSVCTRYYTFIHLTEEYLGCYQVWANMNHRYDSKIAISSAEISKRKRMQSFQPLYSFLKANTIYRRRMLSQNQ